MVYDDDHSDNDHPGEYYHDSDHLDGESDDLVEHHLDSDESAESDHFGHDYDHELEMDEHEHHHEDDEHNDAHNMSARDFLNNLRENFNTDNTGNININEILPELFSMFGENNVASFRRNENTNRSSRGAILVTNVANATEDPYIAMESMIELSEMLLMTNQLVLERVIPLDRLLIALVDVLKENSLAGELELQLQTCRCLYNLFEAHERSIAVAVEKGIIKYLQAKLNEISFIDLAEQLLETLELISRVAGDAIFANGNLPSYLQYFDFFTIHAQRKAISIISNSCVHNVSSIKDFQEQLKDVIVALKPIFLNSNDHYIITRCIYIMCSVCYDPEYSAVAYTDLIDGEYVSRIFNLFCNTSISSDNKIKCSEILTHSISYNSETRKYILENIDLVDIFTQCLMKFSKSSASSIHETIMFVPKALLLTISRFITFFFPFEPDRFLTIKGKYIKNESLFENNEAVCKLVEGLTPLLTDFYTNSMSFNIRRFTLLGLLRMTQCMNEETAIKLRNCLTKLLVSSLAQGKSSLEEGSKKADKLKVLIIELLLLSKMLVEKFPKVFVEAFHRDGIFDLLTSINKHIVGEIDQLSEPPQQTEADSFDTDEELNIAALDEEEDVIFSEDNEDIPNERKPTRLVFLTWKTLDELNLTGKINTLCEFLLSILEDDSGSEMEKFQHPRHIVSLIEDMELNLNCYENLLKFWTMVKQCIFLNNTTLSSFEVSSIGLVTAVSKKLQAIRSLSNTKMKNAIQEAFGDNLVEFVNILQSALTRTESFMVLECGLNGEEGGMNSLSSQIRLVLTYDGNEREYESLSFSIISIQCIATYKTLTMFIKDRIVKDRFFSRILPLANERNDENTSREFELTSLKDIEYEFFYENEKLYFNDTIFGSIFKILRGKCKDVSKLWNEVQKIRFQSKPSLVEITKEEEKDTDMIDAYNEVPSKKDATTHYKSIIDIMAVLKILRPCINDDKIFINSKLSAKLARQLDEPLIVASGILPEWLLNITKDFYFLFPFDSRLLLLQSSSFGYGRLIQIWKNRMGDEKTLSSDDPILQLGRMTRSKLAIHRTDILVSALKILDDYSDLSTILEFQYIDEEGTGLGPTLEFYATVSKEFAKRSLNLWRADTYNVLDKSDTAAAEYIDGDLFPKPLKEESPHKDRIIELFSYLGKFIARSMLDSRIVDFRFNEFFFQLAHWIAQEGKIRLDDLIDSIELIALVDKQLESSLRYIYDNRHNEDIIRELSLTFVLPGTDIELVSNGQKLSVHSGSVTNYIRYIISYTIGDGIFEQIKSFIDGFSTVFPYENLLILTPGELVELFGNLEEDWSMETLYASIEANHGYSMDSQIVTDIISILSKFDKSQRRLFLQFLTGSPKLPIGGFKMLKPKFTIVLKHAEDDLQPDQYLPSVMTCANYLKLPKYSTKAVLEQRLMQAIEEGGSAFLLS